ncbi:hypothetical protein ACFOLD_04120 [Kocuria carniphila]|uniref:hypothetical protein n=1 Tax=Kocuria carniphila TaxID=262208 RepID=UPI00360E7BB4
MVLIVPVDGDIHNGDPPDTTYWLTSVRLVNGLTAVRGGQISGETPETRARNLRTGRSRY